jgi:hypothetical protein
MLGIPLFLFLFNLIGFFNKFQKPFLFWTFSIVPPLLYLSLIYLGIDIWSIFFFLSLILSLFVGSIIIIITLVKISIDKKKGKNQLIKYHSRQLIQPILLFIVLAVILILSNLSLSAADRHAIKESKLIQEQCNKNQECPKLIPGWKQGLYLEYLSWGTRRGITYWPNSDGTFRVTVHHDIDSGLSIKGGVNKDFKATEFSPVRSKEIPTD